MRYAIVKDGKVINVAEADEEFASAQGWILCPAAGPRWLYDGVSCSEPPRNIEAEWQVVREKRDRLLIESDSNVLPDRWAAMSAEKQQEWATYRQTLRDIPQTYSDPADVVWPTKP